MHAYAFAAPDAFRNTAKSDREKDTNSVIDEHAFQLMIARYVREREREKETIVDDPSGNVKKHCLMHLDPYSCSLVSVAWSV